MRTAQELLMRRVLVSTFAGVKGLRVRRRDALWEAWPRGDDIQPFHAVVAAAVALGVYGQQGPDREGPEEAR